MNCLRTAELWDELMWITLPKINETHLIHLLLGGILFVYLM